MPKKIPDEARVSRGLERQRQIVGKLRQANDLEHAAALEVDRLVDVALEAGVPVDVVVKIVDTGRVKVFTERALRPGYDHTDEQRHAIRRALSVARGRIVSVTPRKLRHGRDVGAQGRPDVSGDLGEPVWRVEIERGAA